MVDPFFLAGIVGMLLVLIGFFGVQSHRMHQDNLSYDILNLVGSILLVIYGIAGAAWPFVVLNGVWALYSLKDVMGDLMKK
jgi:arginine exporter protein ArgO